MKKCSKCGEVKPLEEFNKDKSRKDGRQVRCRECEKQRNRQYNKVNREQIAERKKQYHQDNREKQLEQNRQYHQDNRKKIAERKKQYCEANREKIVKRKKEYYQANRKQIAEYSKQYRKDNKEACKLREQKRRAREANAAGHCTPEQLQARFDYHGNRCVYCGSEENLTLEHMVPLSKGGTNWPANLAPACESCNCSKGARKTFVEFRSEMS